MEKEAGWDKQLEEKDKKVVAGAPATTKRTQYPSWYQRDGDTYTKRVELVKNLKKIWNIDKI